MFTKPSGLMRIPKEDLMKKGPFCNRPFGFKYYKGLFFWLFFDFVFFVEKVIDKSSKSTTGKRGEDEDPNLGKRIGVAIEDKGAESGRNTSGGVNGSAG